MKLNDKIRVTVGVFQKKLGTIVNIVPEQEKCYCTMLNGVTGACVWLRPTELELLNP